MKISQIKKHELMYWKIRMRKYEKNLIPKIIIGEIG